MRLWYTPLFLLLAGVLFLPIRGGVSVAAANISKVYFSNKMLLNHAAVNPTFSLLSTWSDGDDALYEYEFYPDDTCAAHFDAAFAACHNSQIVDTLLQDSRPNIVLLLVESFGRSTVDEQVDGKAVAPHFQQLKNEGIYFENFYANSYRTDRGTVAVLSGLPAQTKMSIMKSPVKSQRLASIAHSLGNNGYTTSFFYGGDPNFTNTASYLYGTGFQQVKGESDLRIDAPTSKWGYADDVVTDAFIDHVRTTYQTGEPFFATFLTLSSHEPFDVPIQQFDDPMLNSMAFTDTCIGHFVEQMQQSPIWDNLLIILVADHAYAYPYGISNYASERHRIPMLWMGGAIKQPSVVDLYASQSDIAATLLAQMGITHNDFPFSRNIFAPDYLPFAFFCFNNGFGVIDATDTTIYDCTSGQTLSDKSSPQQLQEGKAMLQRLYKYIREL
jgi:phosphoglycerol transferase MdoB-like AlkP superfamily enzyme